MNQLVSITINDEIIVVTAGSSVAAAIALSGNPVTRISVTGQPRAPVCGMGPRPTPEGARPVGGPEVARGT